MAQSIVATDLVVVDGPNLFNAVLSSLADATNQAVLREYIESWLDFDRVVGASISVSDPPTLGTVIFHSQKQLGTAKTVLFESADVRAFWARQGSNSFCSTEEVSLPGTQIEELGGSCDTCGKPVRIREKREKGVDTSITSFLWETSRRWDSVVVVSGDGDLVPPVRSLKRRGKRVFCLVKPGATSRDLVQVCTSHCELDVRFLKRDLRLFEVLKPGGLLDKTLQRLQGLCGVEVTANFDGGEVFAANIVANFNGIPQVDLIESIIGEFQVLGWTLRQGSQHGEDAVSRLPRRLRLFLSPDSAGSSHHDQYLRDGLRRHRDSLSEAAWRGLPAATPG